MHDLAGWGYAHRGYYNKLEHFRQLLLKGLHTLSKAQLMGARGASTMPDPVIGVLSGYVGE